MTAYASRGDIGLYVRDEAGHPYKLSDVTEDGTQAILSPCLEDGTLIAFVDDRFLSPDHYRPVAFSVEILKREGRKVLLP